MFISRYKISGHSMEPTYKEGQIVWVNHWAYLFSQPKVGDVVLFNYVDKSLVKRVVRILPGSIEVVGDNKNDSLKLAPINNENILGRVI